MKKNLILIVLGILFIAGISGCSYAEESEANADTEESSEESTTETEEETENETESQMLTFVDVFGVEYSVEINDSIAENVFESSNFIHDGYNLSYEDDTYTSRLGVDVSHHQGEIDWESVKAAGYDFAIIRIGYRGYSTGNICLDNEFYENIESAQAAGLDVGVYFFSQAVSEEEAEEEAYFVLENLEGYDLQLPVVFDPESILDDDARTDDVTGEQFTLNAEAFCEIIEDAGYDAMIYSNMLWEAYELDLEYLEAYPIWYADYELEPQTPYAFSIWQYTNEGYVDGISGVVDIDIQLIEK